MGGFNSAWFIAIGIGVILVGMDILMPKKWRKRFGHTLLVIGGLLVAVGGVGLFYPYQSNVPQEKTFVEPQQSVTAQKESPTHTDQLAKHPKTIHKAKKTQQKESSPLQTPQQSVSAPNGIAIGRDNLGTATVNNFGPLPLILSDEQQNSISSDLNVISGGTVVIFVNDGNEEMMRFANRLSAAMKKDNIDAGVGTGIASGGIPAGISLEVGLGCKDTNSQCYKTANAVGYALMHAHVVEHPLRFYYNQNAEPQHVAIIISRP